MAWQWRYVWVAEGANADAGKPETFPTQSDAETWLGEHWRALRASGVVSATLLEGDRVVYGPMPLEV
ncbi:MAG: hypothetical protein QOI42_1279 [Frankiaceae bacterium]|jgi:hypothetical protein|nr:hypothetical protein [Frankiaceae bacterium]